MATLDGPLFRPLHHDGKQSHISRAMSPDAIDREIRCGARLGAGVFGAFDASHLYHHD
jgi:hypothetical protein